MLHFGVEWALYEMYTPQLLRRNLLEKGLAAAKEKKLTDDVSLAELIGHPVKIVTGSTRNIKSPIRST